MTDSPPAFSPDSRLSLAAVDRTVVVSSDQAAWTSLLVEQHTVRTAGEYLDIPPTPDQTIVVGVRGAQQIEVAGAGPRVRATYSAGTVGLTAGGHGDRLRRRPALGFSSFEKVNIYVPARIVADVRDRYSGSAHRRLEALAMAEETVAVTAKSLVRAVRGGAPDLYAEAAALWLITHLIVSGPDMADADRRTVTGTRARIDRVLELMRSSYEQPLSLDDLAVEARVSKYHLSRLFREVTGTTPHAYLVDVRLAAAARLLNDSDLSVRDVARKCGFSSPEHFGVAFARRHGVSPRAYRLVVRAPRGQ